MTKWELDQKLNASIKNQLAIEREFPRREKSFRGYRWDHPLDVDTIMRISGIAHAVHNTTEGFTWWRDRGCKMLSEARRRFDFYELRGQDMVSLAAFWWDWYSNHLSGGEAIKDDSTLAQSYGLTGLEAEIKLIDGNIAWGLLNKAERDEAIALVQERGANG